MDAPAPGGLGGTYAGNPLAVASALAVLNIIEEEQLCSRANKLGQQLTEHLNAAKTSVPQIAEVRGLGGMLAVEFHHPESGAPNPEFTKKVQTYALKHGLILLTCGVYGNVIRFLFPLTIPDAVMAEALTILDAALRS